MTWFWGRKKPADGAAPAVRQAGGGPAPTPPQDVADPPQTGLTWLLIFRHFLLILRKVLFLPSRSLAQRASAHSLRGQAARSPLQLCTQCLPGHIRVLCQRTAIAV